MSNVHIIPFSGGSVPIAATGPDKPRVLWNNLMATGSPSSVIATSEPDPSEYPFECAYDGRPSTYWKVEAGTQYLTFVFPSAKDVNSYAYYSTGPGTLDKVGGTCQLQYSLDGGGSWLDFAVAEAPVDTTPIYRSEDTISAARWRWKFVSATDFYVACLSFGVDFQFERGCWVGLSPSGLARDTTLTNNLSQGGNWLGRSVIRNGSLFTWSFEDLSIDFVYAYVADFAEWAETGPFFCLWNKESFPADAAFGWSFEGKNPPPQLSKAGAGFFSYRMKIQARVD